MIALTEKAATKVSELINAEGEEGLALRVAVRPGGCSGFSYDMFFDSEIADDDQTATYGEVKVVVDASSAMMLEGAGFKVVNLGRDVAPEKFVAAVQEHGANVVGISALMTTTMPAMKRTIDALIKAGLREGVKVMIGGAPVSQAFADEIGADGYAKDSTLAVVKANAGNKTLAAAQLGIGTATLYRKLKRYAAPAARR